ncbi:hypothetical protein [Spirochaeta dissipatitropha]
MRKIYVILIGSAIMALIASCGWVMPEEVQIIGKPSVELPAGSTTLDLTEFFDMRAMLEDALTADFGEPSIYLNDDGAFTFEVSQDLIEFNPNDFADDGLSLDAVNQDIDPQEFVVPDMDIDSEIKINVDPIDLPGSIEIDPVSVTALEPDGNGVVNFDSDFPQNPIHIETDGYSSITFSEGFLNIVITTTGTSPGMELSIHNAQLLDSNNDPIATAEGNAGTALGAVIDPDITLEFDLSEAAFTSNIYLSFYLEIENGDGATFELTATPGFVGTKIQAAEGVDFSTDPDSITEELENPLPDNIRKVIIGTGEMEITLEIPGDWEGVSLDTTANLLINGTSVSTDAGTGDLITLILDLDGITIEEDDELEVEFIYNVIGNNASFELTDTPEITATTTLTISNFSEIEMDAEDLNFSQNIGIIFDQDTLDFIEAINLVGGTENLEFSIINGLPTDIVVTLVSQALLFTIDDPYTVTLNFPGDRSTADEKSITLDSSIVFDNLRDDVEDDEGNIGTGIDLELRIEMTGYDEATNTLTLTNVTPGEDYNFSGSINFAPEIYSIHLKDLEMNSSTEGDPQEPMDFSMIADFLPPGVTIDGIEGYLTIRGADFNGELVMIGHYNEGEDVIVLAGGELTDGGDRTNPADYAAVTFETGDDIAIDLETVINTGPSDLVIEYYINVVGYELILADIEDSEPISIGMRLVVPLQLNVPDGGVVWTPLDEDGNPMIAFDEDLFGRESIEAEDDEVAKLLQQVESVALNYGLVNDSGLNMTIRMKQGDFEKQIGFATAPDHKLEFTAADFLFLRENFFMPDIDILLPGGSMPINPDVEVTVSLWMSLKTDIDYTFPITGNF